MSDDVPEEDFEGACFCDVDEFGFTVRDRRFFPYLVCFRTGWNRDIVCWIEANVGKRGKEWLGGYQNGVVDAAHPEFCARFRDQRHAMFFKLRWHG